MGLRFALGRSGAGKTRLCLDEIRAELAAAPDGPPLIMLVPEQATFQAEYALARTPGLAGTIRAQALSFRRLAYRVMQETGGTALVPINENGRSMLLYRIVRRYGAQLRLFRDGGEQHGFIERLSELLTELKRYGITPDGLQELRDSSALGADQPLLERKLHDVELVFKELEAALTGLYMDAEDSLDWLARGFEHSASLRDAELWIDGFNGFTPKEYAALEALIRSARRVTVTLCLDKPYGPGEQPHELELFHPTAETYIRLRELAESAGVELEQPVLLRGEPLPRFADSPMLAHLERHYGGRTPLLVPDKAAFEPEDERCGISLQAAVHRRAEIEAAARDMLRRMQQGGLRWRDIAVMVRNSADYTDYIETIFAEYRIPYFLDQKKKVVHHPLVELIRSALETVTKGWRYEAVFRCVKTEMLSGGDVTREELDRFENYVLAAGIDGWRWLDKRSWEPLVRDALEDEPGQAKQVEPERFHRILACRDAVVKPLRQLADSLKNATSVREMCEALYQLLDRVGAADKLERWTREAAEQGDLRRAREHRQLWDGVMGLLDQLVEMTGDELLPADLFAGMIEAGLDSLKLGAVPPAVDQVLIGSMDRTRPGHVQVCYVLGANDGVMPTRIQEDGILTEQERDRLEQSGIRIAPGVRRRLLDERFLIYNALTMASKHLWISYALSDEEGKSLHPSEVIRQMKQLFPGIPERMEAGEPGVGMPPEEQARYIRHPERAMSYLALQLRAWREGESINPLWWEVYNWYAARPEWEGRLSVAAAALTYRNEETTLSRDTAYQLYGDHLKASVSRMERFVSCPFQHFAVYGLRLEERKLFRLDAPDVGQLFHAALSKLTASLGDGFGALPPEAMRQAAASIVDELVPRLQSRILLSSNRYQFIARKLKQIVAQTALALAEHARRAHFQPVGLEIGFGPDGVLPSLALPVAGGRSMELVGRIDRVDAAETDEGLLLRVLDYKSSPTALKLDDVVHGLTLQMLTYLDVLLTHAQGWLGRPAVPAGVLYFHVHNPLLSAPNGLSPDEAQRAMLKRFKTKGLLLAEEPAIRLMDGQLETGYSEILPVALKKDGGFYGTSSVVSREEWDVLRGAVRRTVTRIGGKIMDGEVAIAPYRKGSQSPCRFCAYKPVCQIDAQVEGSGYVKLTKPPKERIWELLREGAEPVDASVQAVGGGMITTEASAIRAREEEA